MERMTGSAAAVQANVPRGGSLRKARLVLLRRSAGVAISLISFFGGSLWAQSEGSEKALLVKAGRVLDVVAGQYRANQGIYIVGDRIKAIGDFDSIQKTAGHDISLVDLSKFTVLPGLIDAHTHLLENGSHKSTTP